ncbi:MAG TPA: molybdopterin-dependent oxidoreductase [Polyangiales bacterium]|nr:molybdopterin-dependent oxidoreductase [Polyangiales bacterium]
MTHYTAAHWGIYEVHRTDQGPELRPFARDPDPSPIGLDQLDPELKRMRVARPAVRESFLRGERVGGLRGREPFVEVPWDEALDLVARELTRVRSEHGNRAIFGGSYGWSSAGRFHHAVGQVHRFLNLLGGYVRSVDSYSLGAGRALLPHLVTDMDDSNASHTSWSVLAKHCQLFVSFGGVPLKNTQVSSSGAGRHRVRAGLKSLADAGVRCVNISPVRDNFETGGDVEWIPIRPNTDTALMLALAYEVETQPGFDRSFVDRYCVGYETVSAYLRGQIDGVAKTPAWAAQITGVPVERIRALAVELRSKRSIVNVAWALQRAAHGEQPFWALITLASLLGQIGLPGGGYGLGYGAMNAHGSAHARIPGPVFPQGQNAIRDFIPCARIADLLLQPGVEYTYQGETRSYPDIRFVYWAGGNPFHHHQDLHRLERAWQRPETIVVHEQWWTPTARRADIVLPATTTLERDDIGFATREGFYIAMKQAVAPYAEARDDHAIFAALAERFGVDFTEGLSPRQWQERMYRDNATKLAGLGVELPSYEEFWERGLVDLGTHDREHVMHEAFRRDPAKSPLRTPSGKIELYSAKIASFGLDDCPGYAVWREPFEWLGNADKYTLHMLSDQPQRRLHSQLDGSTYSQAGKVAGREPVYINTLDAAARGIADGDLVELFNDRGRCLAGAIVTDGMMPGVVRLATGSWNDFAVDGLDRNANPNTLTLDRGASGFSQGCAAQTCLVDVRRFEGEPPAVECYGPPALL